MSRGPPASAGTRGESTERKGDVRAGPGLSPCSEGRPDCASGQTISPCLPDPLPAPPCRRLRPRTRRASFGPRLPGRPPPASLGSTGSALGTTRGPRGAAGRSGRRPCWPSRFGPFSTASVSRWSWGWRGSLLGFQERIRGCAASSEMTSSSLLSWGPGTTPRLERASEATPTGLRFWAVLTR